MICRSDKVSSKMNNSASCNGQTDFVCQMNNVVTDKYVKRVSYPLGSLLQSILFGHEHYYFATERLIPYFKMKCVIACK